MIAKSVLDCVGRTPLVELSRFGAGVPARILGKFEAMNPCSSVKDRVGVYLLEAAEARGELKPGAAVIEPTSGNTGVGLAMAAAVKGYRLILTMPENMSSERRKLLRQLGAELVLTPAAAGMNGAVEEAERLAREIPGAFLPRQFDNADNPDIHRKTTAEEILTDTEGSVDAFVAGIGTGGTLTGVGEVLRRANPKVRIVGVEPAESPLLSEGRSGAHGIQGIGANFVPAVFRREVATEIVTVTTADAVSAARELARREGMLVGISSGAALAAARNLAGRMAEGQTVVVLLPDTGERYLSTDLFLEESNQ